MPARDCHCFWVANMRVCQSIKSAIAAASLAGGMNAIMPTVSMAVPMKTRLVVGTPSMCVTA